MENLKNVNISEDELRNCKNLAMQPVFAKALKRIDDLITQAKSGVMNYANYKVSAGEDALNIDMSYSIFSEEDKWKSNAIDKNNRFVKSFKMSLDSEQNFVMLVQDGSFYQKKAPSSDGVRNTYPDKVTANYSFERTVVKKDTETVIERDFVSSPLNYENNVLDVYIPFKGLTSVAYEDCDKQFKTQIESRTPEMERGAIDFNKRTYKSPEYYSAYSAVRDSDDLEKVTIREFLHYPNNLEISTKDEKGNFVNMSNPNTMRIDSPYGKQTYTASQFNSIKEKKEMLNDTSFSNEGEYGNGKSY